jgi:hypothetical protein
MERKTLLPKIVLSTAALNVERDIAISPESLV